MKKRVCIMLLAALLCLTFTGCTLDSYRQSQVFYNDAGNILWKGQEYMLLPDNGEIDPVADYETELYATDKNVPMLLQEMYGDRIYASKDEKFLISWYGGTYCRSDLYEEYKDYSAQATSYCYGYDVEGGYKYYLLDEKEQQWIEQELLAETLPSLTEEDFYEQDYGWITDLETCTEDMLFRKYAGSLYMLPEQNIYVMGIEGEYSYRYVQIPTQLNETLEEIFKFAL